MFLRDRGKRHAGSAAAADCGILFDDFNYSSSADPSLTAHGWVPRSYQGGPGVPGATWSASNITFPSSGILQLNSQTDGTAYRNDPWYADNTHSEQRQSFDGWHTLVAQVSGGHVKYYIDGTLVGDHSGHPRQTMTINYNLWFIDTAAHTSGVSKYIEQVDWLYFAKNQVVAPADAVTKAAAYRSGGNGFVDTVDSAGVCTNPSPSFPPSSSPSASARPSSSPSRSPSSSPLPGGCAGVPAWNFSTVYTTGDRVTHTRSANGNPSGPPSGDGPHLWRAKWWTQGSEPGWTANWEDLGHC